MSKSCPTKLIPFFEKLEKMAHLLSIWMSLLSNRNWEANHGGRKGSEDRYLLNHELFLDSISEKYLKRNTSNLNLGEI